VIQELRWCRIQNNTYRLTSFITLQLRWSYFIFSALKLNLAVWAQFGHLCLVLFGYVRISSNLFDDSFCLSSDESLRKTLNDISFYFHAATKMLVSLFWQRLWWNSVMWPFSTLTSATTKPRINLGQCFYNKGRWESGEMRIGLF